MDIFQHTAVEALIRAALAEDIGRGDLTTRLTVAPGVAGRAEIVAKQAGVMAGGPIVGAVFAALGSSANVDLLVDEGAAFGAGTVLARLDGPAADLLAGERVALNFLQRLCGVATTARRYADAVAGTGARVVDTRKTTPGFRVLEKYAVRMGGCSNHRGGLDDGILIKENHITAAGGVAAAVHAARAGAPHTVKVEIECTNMEEIDAALGAAADAILLDNMTVEQIRAAVRHIAGRVAVEASGGVTLDNVRAIAECGVDLISVGALTHSVAAIDLSMRLIVGSSVA
jgi:nicotinate-nucleotide pyrophosphorylase (carboxylating)